MIARTTCTTCRARGASYDVRLGKTVLGTLCAQCAARLRRLQFKHESIDGKKSWHYSHWKGGYLPKKTCLNTLKTTVQS